MLVTSVAVVILGIIIGLALGRHKGSVEIANRLRENERLREENVKKEIEVGKLRRELAQERESFQRRIKRSVVRYDSLKALSQSRETRLLIEIRRLKNSTAKQLEDEAERIYRTAADTIQ